MVRHAAGIDYWGTKSFDILCMPFINDRKINKWIIGPATHWFPNYSISSFYLN